MFLDNIKDYKPIQINRFRIDIDENNLSSVWTISDLADDDRYRYRKEDAIIVINTNNSEVNKMLCEVIYRELNTNKELLELLDENTDDGDEDMEYL